MADLTKPEKKYNFFLDPIGLGINLGLLIVFLCVCIGLGYFAYLQFKEISNAPTNLKNV
jgi:hypothetical protein